MDSIELQTAIDQLDGWSRNGDAITKQFVFDSFRDAIDFIVRVADAAEKADHHPELKNVYSRVSVRLTSHDARAVTVRDVELARAIDQCI
ncbi:MAG: 4a-hydroxytetrahydrobiopterin dehydratase [Nitriliruptoraceae bacterium]